MISLRFPCLLAMSSSLCLSQSTQKPTIDFQREIRPILSDNCFQCHGPDSGTRMAGLRLDLKETAMAVRKNGAPVVAGKPAESLLYQRISAADAARRMPPESSHKSLNAAQIAKLKLWIEQGAPWQEHWAYHAPVKAAPPAVRNAVWARNPIDRFVLAKLEAKGLEPAAAADRHTLIRRVALDLTGLPPTPAELDAYMKDASAGAYEHMVDRYLASPHYGEHRARYWLDAARYGDTHGIHVDNYREIWPFRDWVIQAYNRNQPYNEFSTEQLAGDLLPNATLDQKIATGFIRCGVSTNEAGIIEDEYAEIYAKDRAETASAVYLGLTVGCATCHDHKFDPITQKDFYSFGAFFRNTTQRVMDDNVPDTAPVVVVPRPEDRESWAKTTGRLSAIRAGMNEAAVNSAASFEKWLSTREPVSLASPLEDKAEIFAANLTALAQANSGVNLGDSAVDGRGALHFQKNQGVEVADAPKLDAEKAFSLSVSFYFPKAEQGYTIVSHNNPKDKNRGWTIDVGARVPGLRLTGDGGKSIEIRAAHLQQLQPGSWNHIAVSYDGSRHQSGLSFYLNGRAVPTQGRGNQVVELPGDIAVDAPLVLGRSLPEGAISDFRIFNRALTEAEARLLNDWPAIQTGLSTDSGKLTVAERGPLQTWFLQREYQPYRQLAKEQDELNLAAKAIASRGAVSLVMEERADAKPKAWILYRGAYDQRRQEVEAGTPSVLPPMTSTMPRNRLGLARWLFTEDNPLPSRVAANRMWQEIFGTGLVKTAEDFGSQGEPASHPELLDWLAVDFREHGWDMKRFYKQIVMSATYRQAAAVTPVKLEKDPENRLLSRAPRFRLDGELVRDYALAATGLLSPQIGGPSVKPYQPEGVWEAVAMLGSNTRNYKQDQADGLYRRSMYTFWKRSAPPASMDIFNAPTREQCTVRRERTDTPLQALVTMNDVQFVEAARELAGRGMQSAFDFDSRLDFVSTRLLARPLTLKEKMIAKKSFERFRAYYAAHEDDAKKFLNQGERKPDPALPQADYAAMAMLTSQLLNLDEVLNK
ncbi:MAG: hypothetical protein QOJ99_1467 [Bryobacterales bacterium]|nr:hypothetical protein [Bryobacterales bacterium]